MTNLNNGNLTIVKPPIVFDVLQQRTPVEGWVIVACWPDGRSEQLIGVFTDLRFAESWIIDQSPIWLSQKEAKPEPDGYGPMAGTSSISYGLGRQSE